MRIVRVFALGAMLAPGWTAAATGANDLRDLHVGMLVSSLPASEYDGFACADDASVKLPDWQAYRTCHAAADGTRAVSFRYSDSDKTEVAGQPVLLALLIDNDAVVTGIRIDTDPNARLYQHKKAFLFALQVRARFGEDGWDCRQRSPTPSEQPVGGVFINEHCEKTTASRRLVLDRVLFRDPSKDLREFTNSTHFTILASDGKH